MSHLCIYQKNWPVVALTDESFVGCCSNATCQKRRTLERAFTRVFSLSGVSCAFPRARAFRVPCIRVPVFAFFSKLEDFIIDILFTGFKERLQKSSEISQF